MESKKIGIALSGGGARGLSHIGVIKVLEKEGIEIKAISGTSIGAVIGAIYCTGTPISELEEFVKSLDWKSYLLFADLSFTGKSIINGKKIEGLLYDFLQDKTFDDCRINFNCLAVDIIKREKIILGSGMLKDAVRASMSIPGLFEPIELEDKILVDGGIIEPLPTRSVKELGAEFIIASMISFKKMEDKSLLKNNSKKLNTRYVIDTSFNIMQEAMSKKDAEYADIAIESIVGDFGFLDFAKGAEIIKRGERAAKAKIRKIIDKLNKKSK